MALFTIFWDMILEIMAYRTLISALTVTIEKTLIPFTLTKGLSNTGYKMLIKYAKLESGVVYHHIARYEHCCYPVREKKPNNILSNLPDFISWYEG